MFSLFRELFFHYVEDAWVFAILHLLFLLYFLYRWRQSWRQTRSLLTTLRKDEPQSEFLKDAEEQIRRYADQGREPDLPRIERYLTYRLDRNPEILRPLVNTFIVIGLMGTLFSLYRMGHQVQAINDTQQILGRMGIAFSASFFGIIWALFCSIFLLSPLGRLTSEALQEVDHKLTTLSAEYPPSTPERTFDRIAQLLGDNVEAMRTTIDNLSAREEEQLTSSRIILSEFRETTRSVITSLAERVETIQARTEETTLDLKSAVTTSLNELKERFIEISESWRSEVQNTIEASERAAESLSQSSNNLVSATSEVAVSLQAVRDSLERTKDLSVIAENIERITEGYVTRTQQQIESFGKGLDETLIVARSIPEEWFTMLDQRNRELTEQLTAITSDWKTHVSSTSEEWSTKLNQVGTTLEPLVGFLAPDGKLLFTLNQFHIILSDTKDWLERCPKTDSAAQLQELIDSLNLLTQVLSPGPGIFPQVNGPSLGEHDGVKHLTARVVDIHTLLVELLTYQQAVSASTPPSASSPIREFHGTPEAGSTQASGSVSNELRSISRSLDELIEMMRQKPKAKSWEIETAPPRKPERWFKRAWPWSNSSK